MYHMGYNAEMIRQGLLKQGYPSAMIDKAVSGQTINVKHEVHVAGKTIFSIFLILVLVGAGGYIFFYTDLIKGSSALLDVSISTDNEYALGQNIRYQVVLTSMGSDGRFDAKMRYAITDENDNVKKSYSETIAVDTKASSTGKISLPSTITPGRYYLKATAEYEGKRAESVTEFDIVEEVTGGNVRDNIKTGEIPKDYTDTTPKTDSETFGKSMEKIKSEAQRNPDKASDCARFTDQTQKDICYSIIAEATRKSNNCGMIQSNKYADDCYLLFILSGEDTICENISDQNTKAYCQQVILVQQMNRAYQENNTAAVRELSQKFEPSIYNNNLAPPSYSSYYNQPTSFI